MADESDLVTVATFQEQDEAELAMGRLEAAGIDCFLVGENSSRMVGGNLGGLQLQVSSEDKEDAVAVLDVEADPEAAEEAEEEKDEN